jgi:hypothetical protein
MKARKRRKRLQSAEEPADRKAMQALPNGRLDPSEENHHS